MAVYLPDTNILIDVIHERRGRRAILNDLGKQGHFIANCAVTSAELYSGARPGSEAAVDVLLAQFVWYDITPEVARRAGRLRFEWARKGVTLALADALIASVALSYDLFLVTDNVRDFPMPELRLHTVSRSDN